MAHLDDSLLPTDEEHADADFKKDSEPDDRPAEGEGTFTSSVFVTFNSAVGTGLLTLPYAFRCAGLYGGIALLLGYTLVELGCLAAIIQCADRSRARSYPEIVHKYLGARASHLFAGVVAVYCFFACTGGFIIIKNVLAPLVPLITDGHPWWSKSWLQVLLSGVIVFPLLCLRNISSLRFSAMLSFAAIMFVVAVVAANYSSTNHSDATAGPLDDWPVWPSFVLAVPNLFLSLQCHIQVPSIYAEMKPEIRSVRRMIGACAAAYVLAFILYTVIAVFGVLSFRRLTKPNIMECDYDIHEPSIIVARLCLTLTSIFSIPVNHHPAREAIWGVLSGGSSKPMPRREFAIETLTFFALALGIGCVIDELSTLNDLMGLSAGVTVIFILPSFFLLSAGPTLVVPSTSIPCGQSAGLPSGSLEERVGSLPGSPVMLERNSFTRSLAAYLFMAVGIATLVMSIHSFIGSTWFDVDPLSPHD